MHFDMHILSPSYAMYHHVPKPWMDIVDICVDLTMDLWPDPSSAQPENHVFTFPEI